MRSENKFPDKVLKSRIKYLDNQPRNSYTKLTTFFHKMESTVRESDSCHPIFRTWEIPYGKFNAGSSTAFPLTVFQKLSARPRTRRRPITMPNVKACAPLAQLCNVPRARQRIVSARYFAWDSPRLWPASGDAKLCYIESANSIGYPAETMLRCDQVGRVFFFFFFAFVSEFDEDRV